ncbi:MAG: hypothetical protein KU29_10405 [Sulfurovum sp. FS06-10]|nr:MAG: hypothetical protein KU29_10405 [Sulfurovum sp. FS06-10]
MEQLLTANVASSMYWLGRYLERVELTLREIGKTYDCIIDVDKSAGTALYKKFNIDLEYTNAVDFLDKAIQGNHTGNLANLMVQARENAIISRTNIDASAFGEIIELHDFLQSLSKNYHPIDFNDIDNALSLISEIWGTHGKKGHRKYSDYFLKLGRLVEELDFQLRFNQKSDVLKTIIKDINAMIKVLNPEMRLVVDDEENMMETIYKTIDKLIVN